MSLKTKLQKKHAGLFVFIAIFAGLGAYLLVNSFAATAPVDKANLWIDISGGSCTRNTATGGGDYVDAQACPSMQAAVAASTNGDTIRMKTGAYGAQNITSDKTSITYVIAEDGTTIGSFKPDSNWVEYQNFTAGNLDMENITPTNVTLRDVNAIGHVTIDGPDNLTWVGGTLSPYAIDLGDWPGRIQIQGIPNVTTNLVLDGLIVQPVTRTAACIANSSGCHTEVVRFNEGVTSAVLRNMTFQNGSGINSATIFTGNASTTSGSVANLTLENNFFGSNGGQPIVDENPSGACGTWMFRNNTMATTGAAFVENDCSNATNVTITGNIGQVPICRSGVTYSKNVWFGGTCGSTDFNAGSGLSSLGLGGADGFHLTSGSPAKDRGDPANFPALDHDGGTRPFGSAPDAGAHEYGSTSGGGDTTPPDTTITSAAIGSTTATTANFTFTSTESGSTFQCSLDNAAYASCTTPKVYTGLSVGSHTFTVRATDSSSNTDTTPATQTWTITATTTKPGDTNADNLVNIVDLSTLLSKWNTNFPAADFNNDNTVNVFDLSILLSNYGK